MLTQGLEHKPEDLKSGSRCPGRDSNPGFPEEDAGVVIYGIGSNFQLILTSGGGVGLCMYEKCIQHFFSENPKGRDHSED
jgi:hypothetical protein